MGTSGRTHAGAWDLYSYSFGLNHAKSVSRLTLPNDGNVEILAITLQP